MAEQGAANRDELGWAEPALKERLLRDPVAVLAERGVHLPAGLPLPVVHEVVRVAFLLWVDGVILPIDQFRIDPFDEGLLFGRGVDSVGEQAFPPLLQQGGQSTTSVADFILSSDEFFNRFRSEG